MEKSKNTEIQFANGKHNFTVLSFNLLSSLFFPPLLLSISFFSYCISFPPFFLAFLTFSFYSLLLILPLKATDVSFLILFGRSTSCSSSSCAFFLSPSSSDPVLPLFIAHLRFLLPALALTSSHALPLLPLCIPPPVHPLSTLFPLILLLPLPSLSILPFLLVVSLLEHTGSEWKMRGDFTLLPCCTKQDDSDLEYMGFLRQDESKMLNSYLLSAYLS